MSTDTSADNAVSTEIAQGDSTGSAVRPRQRNAAGVFSGSVLPPLVLGAFVIAGWYGISYG
ncbi:MAG: hypothetical protein O2870_03935, partial [Actinobacteria bacterium]|nr:hypothetical protein [Actinomycetota bacterium]